MWRGGRGAAAAHPRGRLTLSSQPRAARATVGRRVEAVGPTWGYLGFLGGLLLEDGVGAGGGWAGSCAPRRENCVVKWPRQDGRAIMAAGVLPPTRSFGPDGAPPGMEITRRRVPPLASE